MSEPGTHAAAITARGDLSSRSDVHDLVVEFYRDVVVDEVLEPIFGEVAEVDWAQHIPKLIDY
jgi:hemoglobin